MKQLEYESEHSESISDPDSYWKKKAHEFIKWDKEFSKVYSGNLGNDKWFEDGKLNACYNCIDRWADINPDKIALIYENNFGESEKFTYKQLQLKIFEICHFLKTLGTLNAVTIYLSMSPTAVCCALACARLGIPHSCVFGGFSADSLRLRINDSKSSLLISQDVAYRGEKKIDFLSTVKTATQELDVQVLIFDFESSNLSDNFMAWSSISHKQDFVAYESVPSEHPLFFLYTSGSTGLPKGLIHTTGGYLTYVAYSLKTAFNIQKDDVFCCTADIGWITGHSYCIYGPLCLGITSVILEGLPTFPSYYRFFEIIEKYKITQLYTAPTTIRILKAYFDTHPFQKTFNLSSLKLLGSVGEPINKEAYKFFSQAFGNKHVVDTYFQTETGGIMIAPIPEVQESIPECAALPLPGILPIICDEVKNQEKKIEQTDLLDNLELTTKNTLGKLFIKRSWPGIARGILNDQARFIKTYFEHGIYFTGDESILDTKDNFWIMGRADDVINVSGHRISTAEVESAACQNSIVSEAAIVAINHEIKGQTMILFAVLKNQEEEYELKIKNTISQQIGSFCKPESVVSVIGIPKTATGKIMRRVLRCIVTKRDLGDISTCVNKDVIPAIQKSIDDQITFKK